MNRKPTGSTFKAILVIFLSEHINTPSLLSHRFNANQLPFFSCKRMKKIMKRCAAFTLGPHVFLALFLPFPLPPFSSSFLLVCWALSIRYSETFRSINASTAFPTGRRKSVRKRNKGANYVSSASLAIVPHNIAAYAANTLTNYCNKAIRRQIHLLGRHL